MVFLSRPLKHSILFSFTVTFLIGCGGAPAGGGGGGGSSVNTISFVSQTLDQLVLRGQGGNESSLVTFSVQSVGGQSVFGERVDFEISTTVGGAQILADSAETNASGEVSVVVQSGTVAVSVRVTATISGTNTRAVSEEIQISTSTFIASSFPLSVILSNSVSVNPDDGMLEVESAGEIQGIEIGLQLIATDQFGHKVLDGSRVTIVSPETGLVEPSTCEMAGGICSATWTSTEFDNVNELVTIMAYASGAEEFEDLNANNIYDIGETFVDLGEPFADENENGFYDIGEFYVDINSNGTYEELGNGFWDGPCLVDESECLGNSSTIIADTIVVRLLSCPPEGCGVGGEE